MGEIKKSKHFGHDIANMAYYLEVCQAVTSKEQITG